METVLKSFGIQGKILLWQIINFAVLFGALWFLLYKPIKKLLAEREKKVSDSLNKASELEQKSKELEEEFKKKMSEQRGEIEDMGRKLEERQQKMHQEMKARTEAESKKIITEARELAQEEKAQILKSLEDEVKAAAAELAAKILEQKIDQNTEKKLIEDAVKTLTKS
ncbi:MAG: ATP synthase F0 subunit B [Patescibacteria group bacterium]